jgi:hypothetical protein
MTTTMDESEDRDGTKRSYRFPPEIIKWLDDEAVRTWRSRTSILLEAIGVLRRSRGETAAMLPGELPGQLPLPPPAKVKGRRSRAVVKAAKVARTKAVIARAKAARK